MKAEKKASSKKKASSRKIGQDTENYEIEYDNLAVPEIHTGKTETETLTEGWEEKPVISEFQAIPETNFRGSKKTRS